MSAQPQIGPDRHNGRVAADSTVARVTLRPIGSPLPLGALALVPVGLIVAGTQLGWFTASDQKMVPFILLGFAVPLQLVASIFAFLGRDSLVGTGFGMFTGTWLAYGLALLSSAPGQTSHVLGVFFLAMGGAFALLAGGGIVGGKAAAGAIIVTGSARFILSGLYEVTGATGVERAAGLVGLVFAGVAAYVGLATLLEDNARRPMLPMGRRGMARAAVTADLEAQLRDLEHEAGVREQL